MSVAPTHPRQCKLLGAQVEDYGTVFAVSLDERWGVALVGRYPYFWTIDLWRFKQFPAKQPKTQQPYLETYETHCGTEMYVLACTPDEVNFKPPAHRRHLFRRARA